MVGLGKLQAQSLEGDLLDLEEVDGKPFLEDSGPVEAKKGGQAFDFPFVVLLDTGDLQLAPANDKFLQERTWKIDLLDGVFRAKAKDILHRLARGIAPGFIGAFQQDRAV